MNIKANSRIYKTFKILASIGKGGFAEVYKVEYKHNPNTFYALKYLTIKNTPDDITNIKRFKQEIDIYKKIKSQNVAAYVDSYVGPDEYYLVMEFVDGESLKDKLAYAGRLTPRSAVSYGLQIAEGVHELHISNILHRDIKSNNILISRQNQVKIIDFGLALGDDSQRFTQTLKVVGSVYYMAPELCVPNAIPTVKSDIYALGILLFELIGGFYPIAGKDAIDTIRKQKNQEVPSIKSYVDVPQALANVIIKATAKNPNYRYNTMLEMKEDLATSLSQKRYFEQPLDLKKAKPNKKVTDVVNSKKFLWIALSIFAILFFVGISLIIVYLS